MNAENVKRPDRIVRYKPLSAQGVQPGQEDLMPDYLNILGMIFSMLGLMMKLKYCVSCYHELMFYPSKQLLWFCFRPGLRCKSKHLMTCQKIMHSLETLMNILLLGTARVSALPTAELQKMPNKFCRLSCFRCQPSS